MAVSFLTYDVSDLCLGKPALRSLPPSATVGDALSALKTFGDYSLTVFSADDPSRFVVGKVSVVDVVCFLLRDNNLSDLSSALSSPISDLLSEAPPGSLLHVNPNTSIGYHEPATSAIPAIALAHTQQTSVAVVSPDGKLIGEISPSTIAACDESVVPAIATLSAGDLMAFIDCGGPPADLVEVVKAKLRERDMAGMLELIEDGELDVLSSSSDEESATSPTGTLRRRPLGMFNRTSSYSSRMARRSATIVCHPESSLVAVMVQALVHRVNYVWVIENDYSLAGIVTFRDVLKVFQAHLLASYD